MGGKTVDIVDINPMHRRITVVGDDIETGEVITGKSSTKSFTIQSVTNSQDGVHHYVDANKHKRTFGIDEPSKWSPVSYHTVETDENEKKRTINVIRPNRMRRVIREFERIMSDE